MIIRTSRGLAEFVSLESIQIQEVIYVSAVQLGHTVMLKAQLSALFVLRTLLLL